MQKSKRKRILKNLFKHKLNFILLFLFSFFIRITQIRWDFFEITSVIKGFSLLHPDERMLYMVTDRVRFFSNLDPDFFNYGSLPIYLLQSLRQIIELLPFTPNKLGFDSLPMLGRTLTSLADAGTVVLIYFIAKEIFAKLDKKQNSDFWALIAAIFYNLLFFPIQNSKFFISDVFLNFFAALLLYQLIKLSESKKIKLKNIIFFAMNLAALITTKFSGLIFIALAQLFFFIHSLNYFKDLKKKRLILSFKQLLLLNSFFLIFSFIFMPYAFLRFDDFWRDISLQLRMNSDPYVFPYTLQYVKTTPYLYYLKNIFLWGAGPFITTLAFLGLIFSFFLIKTYPKSRKPLSLLLGFYLIYFFIIGRSAVKFMRYLLPMYPLIALLAALLFFKCYLLDKGKEEIKKGLVLIAIFFQFIYLSAFLNLNLQEHPRIAATKWILKNIPPSSTLAVEHWDDRLPLVLGELYNYEVLELYNRPDDLTKWRRIEQQLLKSDYIIISSNRLYGPIQRLADCSKYKVCYPLSSQYYTNLFTVGLIKLPNSVLKFKKVAEFKAQPEITLPLINLKLSLDDQNADESFTVYDHPKVMIFKKQL